MTQVRTRIDWRAAWWPRTRWGSGLVLAWLLATALSGYYYDYGLPETALAVASMYAAIVLSRALCILVLRMARKRSAGASRNP
jgi:hypothetical protein